MNWKRGQVTIYIIIGIILVFTVLIYGTIRLVSVEKGIPEIPIEDLSVEQFVTKCVRDLSLDAVVKIGEHGGYINPEDFGIVVNDIRPTEGRGIRFSENSPTMAYWWHFSGPDDASELQATTEIPILEKVSDDDEFSIAGQIGKHIGENIFECVGEFETFRSRGIEVTVLDLPDASVEFGRDVIVDVDYPLSIQDAGTGDIRTISEFRATVDVDLKPIYDLAFLITATESNNQILERQLRELLEAFGRTETDQLPPTADITFEPGGGVFWAAFTIKNIIAENILLPYTPALQIKDSANFKRLTLDSNVKYAGTKQRVWDNNILDFENLIQEYDIPRYETNFLYLPIWPIYFDVNDDGGTIRPNTFGEKIPGIGFLLSFIGLQDYNTVYDISWPVLVTIVDRDALGGEGYKFAFALEGNIRNNRPLEAGETIAQPQTARRNLFCDQRQRLSGDVEIIAKSGDESIADVQIRYKCADDVCFIGNTDNEGKLITKLPICQGGFITLLKEGFLSESEELSTAVGEEAGVSINLDRVYELEADINKKFYSKVDLPRAVYVEITNAAVNEWNFVDISRPLGKNEEVFIVLERIPCGDHNILDCNEEEFSAVLRFTDTSEKQKLGLAPGTYEISILIQKIYDPALVIPEDKRCMGVDLPLTDCAGVTHVTPKMEFPVLPTPTIVNWTVTKDQLEAADAITFYGLFFDLESVPETSDFSIEGAVTDIFNTPRGTKRVMEDIEELNKFEGIEGEKIGISKQNRQSLLPVLR